MNNFREPMWDKAIKLLVAEGDLEPTVYNELTQHQIQRIILDKENDGGDICNLFIDFAEWIKYIKNETTVTWHFGRGNELWLLFLMATYYAKQWDWHDGLWLDITKAPKPTTTTTSQNRRA